MKFEIKDWLDSKILYTGEGETIAEVVTTAVSAGVSLYRARLDGARLDGARPSVTGAKGPVTDGGRVPVRLHDRARRKEP